MATIRIGKKVFKLPQSRAIRLTLGFILVLGGVLGFLPILGFWMIPLGVLMLSVDLPIIRRLRRRLEICWLRRKRPKNQKTSPDSNKNRGRT